MFRLCVDSNAVMRLLEKSKEIRLVRTCICMYSMVVLFEVCATSQPKTCIFTFHHGIVETQDVNEMEQKKYVLQWVSQPITSMVACSATSFCVLRDHARIANACRHQVIKVIAVKHKLQQQ